MRYTHKADWIWKVSSVALIMASSLDTQLASAVERIYTIIPSESSIAISGSVRTEPALPKYSSKDR